MHFDGVAILILADLIFAWPERRRTFVLSGAVRNVLGRKTQVMRASLH